MLADGQRLEAKDHRWLEDCQPLALVSGTALLGVSNEYAKSVLEGRLAPLISDTLSRECGQPVRLAITVTAPPPDPQDQHAQNRHAQHPHPQDQHPQDPHTRDQHPQDRHGQPHLPQQRPRQRGRAPGAADAAAPAAPGRTGPARPPGACPASVGAARSSALWGGAWRARVG